MISKEGMARLSEGQFAVFTALVQLLPFFIFLLFFGFDHCILYGKHKVCLYDGSPNYRILLPYINYFIFAGVVIINTVQVNTQSELLASVMNVALILFIFADTEYAFSLSPIDYSLFIGSLILTLPLRVFLAKRFSESRT